MKRILTTRWGAGAITGALLVLLAGCAAKKPLKVLFRGCVVQQSWQDEQGRERRDCVCQNGKEIGIDARTHARIIRCK